MSEPSSPTETPATPPASDTPAQPPVVLSSNGADAPAVPVISPDTAAPAAESSPPLAPIVPTAPDISDLPPPVVPPKKAAPPPPTGGAIAVGGGGMAAGPLGRFLGGGGGAGKKEDGEDGKMGFMDHLLELRKRLWVSALTLTISIVLSVVFYKPIYKIMTAPLAGVNNSYRLAPNYNEICATLQIPVGSDIVHLSSLDPLDTMMMVMWLGLGVGLLFSSPIILYEGWSFIAPGLRDREKNAIRPVLTAGIGFFLSGAAVAYFVLFPITMTFLVWLNIDLGIHQMWSVERYMSLLLTMMALCGLVCEAPLVVAVLAKLGLVKASHLTRFWRPIVLGAFIAGSVLSPGTDVMSMLLFTALLLSLYIVSILFAWVFYRDKK